MENDELMRVLGIDTQINNVVQKALKVNKINDLAIKLESIASAMQQTAALIKDKDSKTYIIGIANRLSELSGELNDTLAEQTDDLSIDVATMTAQTVTKAMGVLLPEILKEVTILKNNINT